jgi:metallophosphoesterase superfamily enzyme
LARLARLIARYAPRLVVALGDSFHDRDGPSRITDTDRAALRALQRGREWIWIAGNHDPEPAEGIGGIFCEAFACDPVVFRHAPQTGAFSGKVATGLPKKMRPEQESGNFDGEIAGHLHPVARVVQRGRTTSRRCFAGDGRRLVMPAFGAYTGGLNVRDRAFTQVFGTLSFTAHMLGERRLYAIAARRCLAD